MEYFHSINVTDLISEKIHAAVKEEREKSWGKLILFFSKQGEKSLFYDSL